MFYFKGYSELRSLSQTFSYNEVVLPVLKKDYSLNECQLQGVTYFNLM